MSVPRLILAVLCVAGILVTSGSATAVDPPLAEEAIVSLIELQIDDDAIVARVEKAGLAFEPDDAAIQRLADAGASEVVIQALRNAGTAKKPAVGGKAITFQDITKLLELGIDEATILKRLEKSPTVFVLDAEQVTQLKEAGASESLLSALQRERPISAQAAELITDFAIILDCSGSMKEKTKEGETKMAVAQRVVTDLIEKIPEGLEVTLIIYGHEVFGGANDPRNCKAVRIARPLSPLDTNGKSELSRLIAGLKPTGATPIALSLKTAGAELARHDTFCGLVLITDGKETCQGDPVGEAAQLVKDLKITFGVNVVGFDVGEDRAGLEEIAEAGKGKYFNADSAEELSEALQKLRKELEKVAPEAPQINVVASAVSAIVVSPLTVEGFPSIEEVYVTKPDANPYGPTFYLDGFVQSQKVLGKPLLVPPGEYNIVYRPQGAEYLVTLVKNVKVQAKQTVKVDTNRAAAAITVKDPKIDGIEVENIYAGVPGENPNGPVYNLFGIRQSSDKFGQVMMVTAGEKYDIVLNPKEGQNVTIFEGIEPKGGQLTVVGGDEESDR